jgi:hypothetical protein
LGLTKQKFDIDRLGKVESKVARSSCLTVMPNEDEEDVAWNNFAYASCINYIHFIASWVSL